MCRVLGVLQAKKPHPSKAQSSYAMLTATSWWSLSSHGFEVHVTPSHPASFLICTCPLWAQAHAQDWAGRVGAGRPGLVTAPALTP